MMKPRVLRVFGFMLCLAAASVAKAQQYPAKTITIVAPVPPGGPMDFIARVLGDELQKRWKQTVLVENKPGAGALIGAEVVARAAPDGYTLLIHNTAIVGYPVFVKTKFSVERDLAPVTGIMQGPYVLFTSRQGPKTVGDLLAYAKANPNKLNAAVIPHSLQQLRTMAFLREAGIQAVMIPYAGTAPVHRALMTNESQIWMASAFGMEGLLKEGNVRAIAVLSRERYSALPEVPSIIAEGVDATEVTERYSIFAPAGTDKAIIAKLASEIADILKTTDVPKRIVSAGFEPIATGPEALAKEIADLSRHARDIAAQAGLQPK